MSDPVTPALRRSVLERDGGCVAAILDPRHVCRDQWGRYHVQEGYGRMGLRAPSDLAHLVTLCAGAHLRTHWATSHRPELRGYLAGVAA